MGLIKDVYRKTDNGNYVRSSIVECDVKASPLCKGTYKVDYKNYKLMISRRGKVTCRECYYFVSGVGPKDTQALDSIDTPQKAYLLGWIASDGSIAKSGAIKININKKDGDHIFNTFDSVFGIKDRQYKVIEMSKKSKKWNDQLLWMVNSVRVASALDSIGIHYAPKDLTVEWPKIFTIDNPLSKYFLRGLVEGDGTIGKFGVVLSSVSSNLKNGAKTFSGSGRITKDSLIWRVAESIEVLNLMYSGDMSDGMFLPRKYDSALKFLKSKHCHST